MTEDTYRHNYADGRPCPEPVGKVVCVGRNYAEHARELDNPVPSEPLLFIKPTTALASMNQPVQLPTGAHIVHHELELALLLDRRLTRVGEEEAVTAIAGVGLALDLTLRDVQSRLKAAGHPWEIAKGFDGACPCSAFVRPALIADLYDLAFTLRKNGEVVQRGNSADMLFSIPRLLSEMSWHFTLLPGDVVLTGSPAGVGPLQAGDRLIAVLGDNLLRVETTVAQGA